MKHRRLLLGVAGLVPAIAAFFLIQGRIRGEASSADGAPPPTSASKVDGAKVPDKKVTRWRDDSTRGDGSERDEFGLFVRGLGDLKGDIWSPSEGVPAEIVALGKKPRTFAEAEKPLSVEGGAALIEELKAFESRAKKSSQVAARQPCASASSKAARIVSTGSRPQDTRRRLAETPQPSAHSSS